MSSAPPPGPPPSAPPPGPPPQGSPRPPPTPRRRRSGLIVLAIGLVVLLVAAAVVVILVLANDDSDEPDGDDRRSGSTSSEPAAGGSDEDQIRYVAVESITRWGRAEAGDASACDGIDDLFAVDEDGDGENESAEEQCRSEVGSNKEATLDSAEVTDVEIDGDRATAKLLLKGSSEEDGDFEDTQELALVKVDGTWRVSFD